jgi:hypothetical protein
VRVNYSPSFDDTHDCPGGCGNQVVRNMFACRACWDRLPQDDYRTPILTSRWAGDWEAHSRALTNAMQWYRVDADRRTADTIRDMG